MAIDFGFNTAEFATESVPYAQFINSRLPNGNFGFAIKKDVADLIEVSFKPDENYKLVDHFFDKKEEPDQLYITLTPRLLVLNQGPVLMAHKRDKKAKVQLYDHEIYAQKNHKSYSYVIIMPLNKKNQPMCDSPLRLKCSGFAGMSFKNKFYNYKSPKGTFVRDWYETYCSLTGDKQQQTLDFRKEKVNWFFAHAIYCPQMEKQSASNDDGQSSWATVTKSYIVPNKDNFEKLLIPAKVENKETELSLKIEQWIENTQDWLSLKKANDENEEFNGGGEDVEDTDTNNKVINLKNTNLSPIPF
jgi:hypothetical protein